MNDLPQCQDGKADPRLEILVCSCDKYEDVWRPFFTLFFRYWPDCPYAVNLMANRRSYPDKRVRTVATDAAADWSTAFLQALAAIKAHWVLVVMEDYLLTRPVATASVGRLLAVAEQAGAACVHIYPDPPPRMSFRDGTLVGEVLPEQPFRVNLQAAIWSVAHLRALVRAGETAWDFEIAGTERSRALPALYLCVVGAPQAAPFHYYQTGVVRGKWMPGAVRLCRREGVPLDRARRKVGWVRGLFRDTWMLQPVRLLHVGLKRRIGRH